MEYCLEKWETVEVEGENQLKKVGSMKSGENLSISGEQKIIPLCLIRSIVWNIEIWYLDHTKRYLRTKNRHPGPKKKSQKWPENDPAHDAN